MSLFMVGARRLAPLMIPDKSVPLSGSGAYGVVRTEKIAFFRRRTLRWSRNHARSFPWRETKDPYSILIGELLLQRTRGEHVSNVYEEFLSRWPTPEALGRARASSVEDVIRPLGLKQRAHRLVVLGRELERRGGVPIDPGELVTLPGVGPYVSHAVPVFAAGRDLPLVDWVISRVLRRFFGLPQGKRPNADEELWLLARAVVRSGRARDVWLGTLDLAADVCRGRPRCEVCPLNGMCEYPRNRTSS